MTRYFIIFCFLICIISCKKYGHGHIKGTVTESDTGTPIPNAKVIIGRWKKEHKFSLYSSAYSPPYEIIDSTYTDNNGEYWLPIDKERKYYYTMNTSHPNYYRSLNGYAVENKKATHNFTLDPLGFVKLRIIKTTKSSTYFDGTINLMPLIYYYEEMPFDIIIPTVFKARGNNTNFIDWSIGSRVDTIPTKPMPRQEFYIGRGDTVLLTFKLN